MKDFNQRTIFIISSIFLLGLIVGFFIGVLVTTEVIGKTAQTILTQYGYNPDVLIKECLSRQGLGW